MAFYEVQTEGIKYIIEIKGSGLADIFVSILHLFKDNNSIPPKPILLKAKSKSSITYIQSL
jgi:hypothetical protein